MAQIIKLRGNQHIELSLDGIKDRIIGNRPAVCLDDRVAFILADSTPSGFAELDEYLAVNDQYTRVFRALVPYCTITRSRTPAEFLLTLSTDYNGINGRLKDLKDEEIFFEEVTGLDAGPWVTQSLWNEWPFPHTGTRKDIRANGQFGSAVAMIPSIINGMSFTEEFMLEWKGAFAPHLICVLAAAKFDLEYKQARAIWKQLKDDPVAIGYVADPGLPPRLPEGFSKQRAAELVLSVAYQETIDCPVKRTEGLGRVMLPGGKQLSGLDRVDRYIHEWTKAKYAIFIHKYKQLNTEKDQFELVKEELVQKILCRVAFTAGKNGRLGFLELPARLQREYLLSRLNGNEDEVERLLRLPLKQISRDYTLYTFADVRVDARDAVDLFAEHLNFQIGSFYQIEPRNFREPVQLGGETTSEEEEEEEQPKPKGKGKRKSKRRDSSDSDSELERIINSGLKRKG